MLARDSFNCLTIRYYSRALISLERLALEHIRSNKIITSLIINSILKNQNISVTPQKLEALLKIKGLEFDLSITKDNQTMFDNLVDKSRYSGFLEVYVFIHKATTLMYVDSSNLFKRRMEYYFQAETKHADGKFLSLLNRNGISAFKLKIFKLDRNQFKTSDSLLLKQYMLLNKKYDLNILRVVNFESQTSDSVYVYDLSCTILYYHASSRINLKRVLDVYPLSCNKYVDTKIPYLSSFILLSFSIDLAIPSNLSNRELLSVMNKERKALYSLGTRNKKSVIIEIKEENKLVDFESGNSSLEFNSIKNCIIYLRSLDLTIKKILYLNVLNKLKSFIIFSVDIKKNLYQIILIMKK